MSINHGGSGQPFPPLRTNKKMKYQVPTRFVFTGVFTVEAENREEARQMVMDSCGLVMGGGIHTDLDDEEVDWDFDTHPCMETGRITKA